MAMGRTTYGWILDHQPPDDPVGGWSWPPKVPCWVFTHQHLPGPAGAQVQFTSAPIPTVHHDMAAAAGDRNLWVVAVAIWPASSPTPGCWMRSSCRSPPSPWVGCAPAPAPDRAGPD